MPKSKTGLTKAQLIAALAAKVDMSKSQVDSVMEALKDIITTEIQSQKPVALLGMIKISVVSKSARPSRQFKSPLTGVVGMTKAKPAHKAVKISKLKGLKELL